MTQPSSSSAEDRLTLVLRQWLREDPSYDQRPKVDAVVRSDGWYVRVTPPRRIRGGERTAGPYLSEQAAWEAVHRLRAVGPDR